MWRHYSLSLSQSFHVWKSKPVFTGYSWVLSKKKFEGLIDDHCDNMYVTCVVHYYINVDDGSILIIHLQKVETMWLLNIVN